MIRDEVQGRCPGCEQPIVVTERDGAPSSECGGVDEGLCAEAGYAFDVVRAAEVGGEAVWDGEGPAPDGETCLYVVRAHRRAIRGASVPAWAVEGSRRLRALARAEADRLTAAPMVAIHEEVVGGEASDMADCAEAPEDGMSPEESREVSLRAATARLVRVVGLRHGGKLMRVATVVVVVDDASEPRVRTAASLDPIVLRLVGRVTEESRKCR